MRIPFTKLHRAFPEFDSMTEEECGRYVRYVRATQGWRVGLLPWLVGAALAIAWPLLLFLASEYHWFAVPDFGRDLNIVSSLASGILVGGLAGLLARDVLVWWGVRRQVHRARCPKCKYSLQGLRIEEVGLGLDPAMRFVRCSECGRKHRLMDLGITPMDLVPFEQRGVPEDFAKVRR
jgi:hypothetical protein